MSGLRLVGLVVLASFFAGCPGCGAPRIKPVDPLAQYDAGTCVDRGDCPGCTPAAEVCNGLDDDYNGTVDDNLNLMPQMCGVGECATVGGSCANGTPLACMPRAGVAELCNGLDDDCDGTVDEGLVANTTGDLRITNNSASSDFVYIGRSDTGFGTVWQDKRDGPEGQIYFAGLFAQGVRSAATDTRVSNTNGTSTHPALA